MSAPTPAEFVATCTRRGIRLRVVGDKIKASGNPPPDPERFAAYLRAQKPALVELLRPAVFAVARNPAPEPESAPKTERASEDHRMPVEAPEGSLGTDVPSDAPQEALREIHTETDAPEFSDFSDAPTRAGTAEDAEFAEPLTRADDLQEHERTAAGLADAWRALRQGLLPIAPIALVGGRTVTRPDTWLLWAVKRRDRLRWEHGPAWLESADGQALALDLYDFADWYLSVDFGAHGQPAPPPTITARPARRWSPRWERRPDPAAVALDASTPWPDGPADTPERVAAWSERVALLMRAQGRHPADVAELVAAYGIGAELGTPARA